MKILFLSSWFPNKLEPTNGNFVQRHAEAVASIHHVEVLHAIGDFHQKEMFVSDDKVINGIRTLIIYYKNSKNPLQNFCRRMKAYKMGFSRLEKPDLVHANVLHNTILFAVYLKKKFKIPFVVTEHWTALRKINQDKTSFSIKFFARYIGNLASYVLPVSNDLKMSLEHLRIKTPMKVIPNVVDTNLFKPSNLRPNVFTFLHISNLISRKNADKILNVSLKLLKKGHQFKLKIGGDGDVNFLREILDKEGFQQEIEVFESLSIQDVSRKMQDSDCFILFSTDENQPCVIAESFASGIQVISTNVGGISEFFPPDFGILIDEIDEALLEKAMLKAMHDAGAISQQKIAEYAHRTFSQNAIAHQFNEVYKNALN